MRAPRLALALSLLASTAYAQQMPGYGPQGGSALPTFTAGSAGASCPGAVLIEAW